MAETLFRQWFIEEAKEDWEEVPLSEVAVIQNGYAFSSKDYVEKTVNEYEVLKMGHIDKNATLKLNPKRDYVPRKPELKRFVLNYNDIVMPMTDMKDNVVILGVPALVDANDKYVLNQRVARIYLKEDSKLSSIYYLFLQLKDPDFIARLQSTANSGVQVNLSTQAIKDCPIVIPSLEKQAEHRNTITGFYEQISNNRKQIQTLENLRDTLLPKLMSGEVRVQYQTEEVA
jgi:type I restriction enzyme S subunit